MPEIKVNTKEKQYKLIINGRLEDLPILCKGKRTFILTDENVFKLYRKRFPRALTYVLKPGERSKELKVIREIYEFLLQKEFDRNSLILGIGGGVVCDIAGFVAATYMRGVELGLVPTTLLAQVDASIGGKNGVNLEGFKNIVGTFYQPSFVLTDFSVLQTLSSSEVREGLAEIIKHALIADAKLFELLEGRREEILKLEGPVFSSVMERAIKVKVHVVEKDEKEKGLRRILNFGHTFGHAFEKVYGLPHGEAVASGMFIAVELSCRKGFISERTKSRIEAVLESYGFYKIRVNRIEELIQAFRRDKKREGVFINFALLEEVGKAKVEKVNLKELEEFLHDLCKHR